MKAYKKDGSNYVPVKGSHDWHVLRLSRCLVAIGRGMQGPLFDTDPVTGHLLSPPARELGATQFVAHVLRRHCPAALQSLDVLVASSEAKLPPSVLSSMSSLRQSLQALSQLTP